jgi:hypothetical protein
MMTCTEFEDLGYTVVLSPDGKRISYQKEITNNAQVIVTSHDDNHQRDNLPHPMGPFNIIMNLYDAPDVHMFIYAVNNKEEAAKTMPYILDAVERRAAKQ